MRRHLLAIVPCITALLTASAAAQPPGGMNVKRLLVCETRQDLERPLVLAETTNVLGARILNRGEELGTLRDLVIDRRTGRAAFGIVASEGALGLGEVDVVIPYGDLGWHTREAAFVSDLDEERLAAMPVFSAELLQELGADADAAGRPAEGSATMRGDVLAAFFEVRMPERITGEIVTVSHWSHESLDDGHGEYVALTIEATGGDSMRILLGPPAFIEGAGMTELVPGASITAGGVPGNDDAGDLFVATDVELGEETLELRDEVGAPLWKTLRYSLVSDLTGRTLVAGSEEVGRPVSIVVDVRSGQIVFAVLELDGERCPIPMRTLMVAGDDRLILHGRTTDGLAAAPRLFGEEIGELNDPALRAAIYEFFSVDAGSVLPRRS